MEQLSQEWFAARLGKITGSKKAHLLLSGPATRKTLLAQLFRETATAEAKQIPVNDAMARGTALEPEAVKAYEELTGLQVHSEGLVVHPDEPRFAMSPDGLVGDEGGIEIKCREPEQHLKRMIYGIEKDEIHQCQWSLFCAPELEWLDYVGFCPELPPSIRIFTQRIVLNPTDRDVFLNTGNKLLKQLDEACAKYKVGF